MSEIYFEALPLFQGLTSAQMEQLRPLFVHCDCFPDGILFEQGDSAEYLYLVVEGEVTIRYKPEDGPPITVTRVRPGGVVGWSAALGSRYYTSGAFCNDSSQMLRVRGVDLRDLCEQDPETGILILERLAAVIAQRLRNTHEQVIELLKQGIRSRVPSLEEI